MTTETKPLDIPSVGEQERGTQILTAKIRQSILSTTQGPGANQIIYADPPWEFGDKNKNGNRGASCKYPVMSMGQLFALRPLIDYLASSDCVLAMWWVDAMPQEALELVKVWGFDRVKMNGLVWHKQTKNGKEHFGLGRTTRPAIESCLFAYRGKKLEVKDKAVRQVITAKVGEHSEKPHEARKRIERLWGDVKRIEMFARHRVEGWEAWGNQV